MQESYLIDVSNRFNLLLNEDIEEMMLKIEHIPVQKKTPKTTVQLSDKTMIKLAGPKKLGSKPSNDEEKLNALLQARMKCDGSLLQQSTENAKRYAFKQQFPESKDIHEKLDCKSGRESQINSEEGKEKHFEFDSHEGLKLGKEETENHYDADDKVGSSTGATKKNHGFQNQSRGNFSGRRGRTFYGNRGDNRPYRDYKKDTRESYQQSYHGRYNNNDNSSYQGTYNNSNRSYQNEEEYGNRDNDDVKEDQTDPRGAQSTFYNNYNKSEYHGRYKSQYYGENYKYEYMGEEHGIKEEYHSFGNYNQKGGQDYYKKPAYYGQNYGNNNYEKKGYAEGEYTNSDEKVEETGGVEYQGRNEYQRENRGNYKPAYRGNRYNAYHDQYRQKTEDGGWNEGYQTYGRYQRGKPRVYSSYHGNNKNYQEQNCEEFVNEEGVEYGGYKTRGGGYKSNYRGRGNRGGYYKNYTSYFQDSYDNGYQRENDEQMATENEVQAEEVEQNLESTEKQQESTEQTTNVDAGEYRPDAWYLEVEKEEAEKVTLDEFRALKAGREKPVFNLRQAGEGEDTHQWQSMYALENKKARQDSEPEDEGEPIDIHQAFPQRAGRQKKLLDINIRFSDSRQGGRGRGRSSRGGRGRGFHQDYVAPKECNPIEWCEPPQEYIQHTKNNTYDEEVVSSDWTAPPPKSTFYSGRVHTESWPQISERNGDTYNNRQFMNKRGGNIPFVDHRGYKNLVAPKVDDEKDFPPLC